MADEPENTPASDEPPRWLCATAEDFGAVDLNAPIAQSNSVETYKLSTIFNEAVKAAEGSQLAAKARVYAMLGAVCSFYFRPENRDDPFGPMARFGDRRTPVPEDFKGAPVEILANSMARIENPAVRARVADTVWLLERRRADAGWRAIEAYAQVVTSVRDGRRTFRSDVGVHGFEVAGHLRRGIQIARVLGWDKEKSVALRELVSGLRADAATQGNAGSFRGLAALDLDYQISAITTVAEEAERLAGASSDQHVKHDLLHIAARARRIAKDQPAADRLLLQAAECLVLISQGDPGSGMFEAHWLERAISEMHNVPGTKDRRRELKHKLVDAQSRIIDEMTLHGHSDDISEVVASSREAVSGKSLIIAISAFYRLSHALTPAEIEEEARKVFAENPLATMFAATQYDAHGKPVRRDGGMESGER